MACSYLRVTMRALGCSTFGTVGGERSRSSPTAGWTWHSNHLLQTTSELSCINSHRSLLIVLTPTSTDRRIRYGAMWWLNTDGEKGRMYPSAPTTSYTAQVSSRTTHATQNLKMRMLCGQPRSAGPLHGCHSRLHHMLAGCRWQLHMDRAYVGPGGGRAMVWGL
eukprot:COSAG02_NODE_284_length_25691_cov_14.733354_26_plen_164_part_00